LRASPSQSIVRASEQIENNIRAEGVTPEQIKPQSRKAPQVAQFLRQQGLGSDIATGMRGGGQQVTVPVVAQIGKFLKGAGRP
jgi:hypothetical protein